MVSQIKLNPDIVSLPYGDRKKLLALTQGRKDLADLMSGNPDMALPPFIRERLRTNWIQAVRLTQIFTVCRSCAKGYLTT